MFFAIYWPNIRYIESTAGNRPMSKPVLYDKTDMYEAAMRHFRHDNSIWGFLPKPPKSPVRLLGPLESSDGEGRIF